eukprot:GGOE01025969.1.p1 GENE.GGOE01025969.1~~GGOE01025969.1.p1  ORF type:complete len:258 (-),score=41.02 GGOE01025969.1:26-757(-)
MGCACPRAFSSCGSSSDRRRVARHSYGAGRAYKVPPIPTHPEPGDDMATEDAQDSPTPSTIRCTTLSSSLPLTPSDNSSNFSIRSPHPSPHFTVLVPLPEEGDTAPILDETQDPERRQPPQRRRFSVSPHHNRQRQSPASLTFKVRQGSPARSPKSISSPTTLSRTNSFRPPRRSPIPRDVLPALSGTTLVLKSKPSPAAVPSTPQPCSPQRRPKSLRRTKSLATPKRQGWTPPAAPHEACDH